MSWLDLIVPPDAVRVASVDGYVRWAPFVHDGHEYQVGEPGVYYVWPEGSWMFLEGGTLDLGIISFKPWPWWKRPRRAWRFGYRVRDRVRESRR